MDGRKTLRYYLRNSIRFRVMCCTLLSILLGLTLAWWAVKSFSQIKTISMDPGVRLWMFFFLALLFTVLILLAQVSLIIQPILALNRRLRQLKSKKDIRSLHPGEFVELGPLLETTVDFMDWSENQQSMSSAIHHAFRKRVEQLAEYDSLTGLYNRYYLKTILPLQIAHMRNVKDNLSAIMLDVDHFKHYNDTNGHPEGDRVLMMVAEILRKSVREHDICCRYGGEEFFITLPNADLDRAASIAHRIRAAIELTDFPHGIHQPLGRLTASLGVATFPIHGKTAEEITECADRALYLAKHLGRNRICTYEEVLNAAKTESAVQEAAS